MPGPVASDINRSGILELNYNPQRQVLTREAWSDALLAEVIMPVGCHRMVAGFYRGVRVEPAIGGR